MKTNIRRSLILVLVLSLMAGAGFTLAPSAQADIFTPRQQVVNALNENWRVLGDGETDWFVLYHRGGEFPVHVWMDVEPSEGAGFYVFTAEDAEAILAGANYLDFDPVGAGTANEFEPGHLFWRGTIAHSGAYYVMVLHGWEGDIFYTIYAAGPGLGGPGVVMRPQPQITSVPAITAQPAEQPAAQTMSQPAPLAVAPQPAAPAAAPVTVPGEQAPLIDPPVEAALGQTWRTLGDGQTRWYTVQHRGGNLPLHIWMDVEPNEGAGFRVFRAEDAEAIFAGASPDDIAEVGRGSPNPVEPGYLFWRGTIANAGTFYVMVEHGWAGDVSYALYASGPGFVETQQSQLSMIQ
jgi:hypothetical protein